MSTSHGVFIPLPAELWGEIFTHVDDFELWVVCRQVSSMLRAEAEREFATRRLSDLDLRWESFITAESVGGTTRLIAFVRTSLYRKLKRFSEGNCRVHLDLTIRCWDVDSGKFQGCEPLDNPLVRTKIIDTLRLSSLDRIQSRDYACQTVSLHARTNPIEVPAMEIDLDAKEISFDWKEALNRFFAGGAYVRRMGRKVSHSSASFFTESK